jgi:hypothetical protein
MSEVDIATRKRNEAQLQEALGAYNEWIAGVNLGKPPTKTELITWYFEHGGPQDFARRHPTLDPFLPQPHA